MIDPPGMTDQTRISPKILDRDRLKIFKLNFSLCMVKDDWPPPGMTDQTRISPNIFKLSFSLCMVKDDWPSRYDRPDQDLT